MSRIWYRALTNYLGPTSEFLHLYYATWLSADDLYGAGSERAAVEFAFDSVGIAPGANEWNLRYDDGSPEFVTWWPIANRGLAGEFYLPGTAKVENVSFYIAGDNSGGTGDFVLKLFSDSSGVPKSLPSFSASTNITGGLGNWIGFDLSSYDILFTNKMYAAIFYDGSNQPLLGKDTSSVWQSWFFNGSDWVSDNAVYFIRAMVSTTLDVDDAGTAPLPVALSLDQNSPNPFNSSTRIDFATARNGDASLEIFNILGQLVYVTTMQDLVPGKHSFSWDGKDLSGLEVSSGVYLYKVKAHSAVATRKMLLLK